MREAVGGSLMLYLIIPIIILFIIFMGFIMSYASAYRSANYIAMQFENYQGQVSRDMMKNTIKPTIKQKYAYVILKDASLSVCHIENGANGYVFRVSLPVAFDIPMFGTRNLMLVKVETKTISNVPSSYLKLYPKCV